MHQRCYFLKLRTVVWKVLDWHEVCKITSGITTTVKQSHLELPTEASEIMSVDIFGSFTLPLWQVYTAVGNVAERVTNFTDLVAIRSKTGRTLIQTQKDRGCGIFGYHGGFMVTTREVSWDKKCRILPENRR